MRSFLPGDVNILLANCRIVELYLNTVFSYGQPTRVTSHSATLIDHILGNNSPFISNRDIWLSDMSDHFTTFVTLKCTDINRNRIIEFQYRERFERNKINFAYEIAMYLWVNIEQVDDPNECFTKFSGIP